MIKRKPKLIAVWAVVDMKYGEVLKVFYMRDSARNYKKTEDYFHLHNLQRSEKKRRKVVKLTAVI